jgi:hypothetical protein
MIQAEFLDTFSKNNASFEANFSVQEKCFDWLFVCGSVLFLFVLVSCIYLLEFSCDILFAVDKHFNKWTEFNWITIIIAIIIL